MSISSATAPSPKARAAAAKRQYMLSRTTGVLDYLQCAVPKSTLKQLYQDEQRGPFVCRAIVQQQLHLESQQVLMRLQCTGGSFAVDGVQVWFTAGEKLLRQVILPELRAWAMIREDDDPNEVTLTPEFQTGFTACLCRLQASPWQPIPMEQLRAWEKISASKSGKGPGNNKKRPAASTATPDPLGAVTPEDLERYTQTVWDSVLHFLVGTDHAMEPPAAVIHFLLQTGLMQTDPDYHGPNPETRAPLVITEKGYDFMLQDNYEQVWHFCLQYLQVLQQNAEKGERMVRECLLLLICLSFCTNRLGQAYSATDLPKTGRRMLRDLAHFGLLYVRELVVDTEGNNTKVIFYPTRVATSLIGTSRSHADFMDTTSNNSSHKKEWIPTSAQWSLTSKALEACLAHPTPNDSAHLAIIVQTNFQVCAYTTSELHVSMLALFCDVGTIRRLPNVVFLRMTRDSVKAAFNLGIQARQILRFLEKHAHPKLRVPPSNSGSSKQQQFSPIPSNVIDQVWLWDRERTRVQATLVFQHQCVMGTAEFQAVYAYTNDAQKHGTPVPHVWSSARDQKLFLDYQHVAKITAFVRQWRAKAASRQAET